MNIFLIHTFLYMYFFPAYFRSSPFVVGFFVLLFASLCCSVVIELCKKVCKVEVFLNYVCAKFKIG